jgi:hypothetical protein
MQELADGSTEGIAGQETFDRLNFTHPAVSQKEIQKFRRRCNRKFYLRPKIIFKHLIRLGSPHKLKITLRSLLKLAID